MIPDFLTWVKTNPPKRFCKYLWCQFFHSMNDTVNAGWSGADIKCRKCGCYK